ncbi:MAG: metallopeptidase family protein [Planctomycetota bacterium]
MRSRPAVNAQEREVFDALLEAHLEALPPRFAEGLWEVPLIVDDEPSAAMLSDLGMNPDDPEDDLFGLHTGVPITERSVEISGEPPEDIRLFRGPIFRLVGWSWPIGGSERGDRALLDEEIRVTLLHELGHHFGLDEDDLDALGYA